MDIHEFHHFHQFYDIFTVNFYEFLRNFSCFFEFLTYRSKKLSPHNINLWQMILIMLKMGDVFFGFFEKWVFYIKIGSKLCTSVKLINTKNIYWDQQFLTFWIMDNHDFQSFY